MRTTISLVVVLLTAAVSLAQAPPVEYRAFWVDTFNTALNTHNDVAAVVANAKATNANTLLVQVRRRGDAWYLDSLEPPPDFVPIAAGFDPLRDLIAEAHANGIEVHAFVIVGAVWNKNPTFAPNATLGPPTNPNHVFNLHGAYDPVTKNILTTPENWLTRTLIPGFAFNGYRFGNDFWLDLGHPDAARHTLDVLMHLVRNYDIDGLHLDRIRYPELSVSGQTPSTGTNIGYNQTSVERFQRRHAIAPGSPPPAQNNSAWSQWRRDQVTNFVRRLYLNATAVKPQIKISGAFIVFGGAPSTWTSAEAYWRVYQDWDAWLQEGIIDIAIPMNYKAEHNSNSTLFATWNEWIKNHQYNRSAIIGPAIYLNSIEGTLVQTRKSLAPSTTGNRVAGVSFYSMATTNVAVAANPLSLPPRQNTPARSFAEFASALKTGRSVNGLVEYEDTIANPTGVFATPAVIPAMPWKSAPTLGHVMGIARDAGNLPIDAGSVTIEGLTRTTVTDGQGFYGGVDLAPGTHLVKVSLGNVDAYACATVTAGSVTTADADVDSTPPVIDVADVEATSEAEQCGAPVEFNATATDNTWCRTPTIRYSMLPGSRFPVGVTIVTVDATDVAGNTTTKPFHVKVADTTSPVITEVSVDKTSLWPINHKLVDVKVAYDAKDNCAIASTSLSVTSNEPVDGLGDGDTSPDWEIVDEHRVRLRAERSGTGDGRVYTITITATDASGVSSTSSVEVTVPKSNG